MAPGKGYLRRLAGWARPQQPVPPLTSEASSHELIRLQSIFNADWYLEQNGDIRSSGQDAWTHFAAAGLREDRNPSPLFDPLYFARHGGTPEGTPKILHYLRVGDAGARTASALFDVEYYRSQVSDLGGVTILEHYLAHARRDPIAPNRLCSPAWILNGLGLEGIGDRTPLEHYVEQGPQGELDPHPWFSNSAYRALQHDVAEADILPLAHFLEWAVDQGRHVHRFLDLLHADSFGTDVISSDVGELTLTQVRPGAVLPWLRDEPLPAELIRHLSAAHRSAASALRRENGGMLGIDWAARASRITLPTSTTPTVSVVIPSLDHADDVIRCLESIAELHEETPFEILLIDDGSTAESAALFALPRGITVMRNEPNRGFAQSCTRGIEASPAPAVMLLNNDTEVLAGWLDAPTALLLDPNRHVGAVGTMVLARDLRLQDAGCQLVGEGWPVQVGRWENPLDATFNIVRPIAYGSGCSLLVNRTAFEAVGGFDPQFEPAFFEETDLCRMMERAGFDILYEPAAVIIHREGSTLGSAGSAAREALFERQAARYLAKWAGVPTDLPPRGTEPFDLVFATAFTGRCVLVVDHRLPEPTRDSGSFRMQQMLLELLRQGYQPVLLSAFSFVRPSSAQQLSRQGIGVLTTHLDDPRLDLILDRVLPEIEFAIASRPHVALKALPVIRRLYPGVPIVFDSVDSHTLRAERHHALEPTEASAREVSAARLAERAILEQADVAIALSLEDQATLAGLSDHPPPFVLVGNIHPAEEPPAGLSGRSGLLFVGGYEHPPNVDGAMWFISEVLPLIEAEYSHVPVILAGSNPPPEIRALAGGSISVPGWLEDLGPLYDTARVTIAPLRFGAGVKGKVGEALARGIPMVATSVGAEGMGLADGIDIDVADDPTHFAAAVVRLLQDDDHWHQLSQSGRAAIDRSMGMEATRRAVGALLDQVTQGQRTQPGG